jgi:hypothetical protein
LFHFGVMIGLVTIPASNMAKLVVKEYSVRGSLVHPEASGQLGPLLTGNISRSYNNKSWGSFFCVATLLKQGRIWVFFTHFFLEILMTIKKIRFHLFFKLCPTMYGIKMAIPAAKATNRKRSCFTSWIFTILVYGILVMDSDLLPVNTLYFMDNKPPLKLMCLLHAAPKLAEYPLNYLYYSFSGSFAGLKRKPTQKPTDLFLIHNYCLLYTNQYPGQTRNCIFFSSEPDRQKFPQQHYFWNEVRKFKKQTHID